MIYQLSGILLGPVLLAQGHYVRRTTPRLPEAAGPRSGQLGGSGQALRLLLVGDSAAAGVGVASQEEALLGQLVAGLAPLRPLHWRLLASSGDTSAQLLARLASESADAADADAVVVSIGVNDVLAATGRGRWRNNLAEIIRLLRERFAAKHIYFSALPPMHAFPALPQPLRWWLGLRARQLNAELRQLVEPLADCSYVQVPYTLHPAAIAEDGFHPGEAAYREWARHLSEQIEHRHKNSIETVLRHCKTSRA
ncbi:SGNH/GDSL hydrolase family protein [Spongiibacter marinus]|uniref:SGNH/GDSL hydrolase family protein n=1 Tax=Spongiibacter marinus TaxID=354246 RepID=UPI0004229878|nr:SGNH/GDSL hydrolase family protein [Spongiibacter marinus]